MKKLFFSLLLGASLAGMSSCDEKVKYTIDVNPKSPSLSEGSSLKITVKSDPEGLPLPEVRISFSPEGIADYDVMDDGYLLKGLKAGKTTMTISYGELSHEIQIQVKKKSSNNDAPNGDDGGNSSGSSGDGGGSSSGDDSGSGDKEPSDDQGGETPDQPGDGDGGNEGEENPSTDPIIPTPGEEEGGEENPGDGDNPAITDPTEEENTTTVTGQEEGKDYVDLGLSVMWATCNIGAENPEEAGLYFAWGDTKGYAKNDEHIFNWENCFDTNDGTTFIIYNINGGETELQSNHDAATQNWGGKWRMPTITDIEELINGCDWTWNDEKKGYDVKSKNNDNSIFLPITGYRSDDILKNETNGYYFSSSLQRKSNCPENLKFYRTKVEKTNGVYRSRGCPVRPVFKQ